MALNNSVSQLVEVDLHDGAAYQPRSEMAYDGLGQRRLLTASEAGLGLTSHYAVDPIAASRPLVAEADGQSTFYLYGLGPLAEFTSAWAYSLPDGGGTPRLLTPCSTN
jgi:hypothetical protein